MWITRDKTEVGVIDIHFCDEKPSSDIKGELYFGNVDFTPEDFKMIFPKERLPLKGSCIEIKGLKTIK